MTLHVRAACVLAMAAVIFLMSSGLGWAQPAASDPSFDRMRAKLKAGDRVIVDLQNGSTVEARVAGVDADAIRLFAPGGDARYTRSDLVVVKRKGRGIILGTIIGAGVGLTFGALASTVFTNEGHDGDGPLFGLTFLGLGVGAGLDAAFNIPRTVYKRGPSRTTLNFDAGPRRTAVRLVVAF